MPLSSWLCAEEACLCISHTHLPKDAGSLLLSSQRSHPARGFRFVIDSVLRCEERKQRCTERTLNAKLYNREAKLTVN